jgi:predicted double-glycine peptidase
MHGLLLFVMLSSFLNTMVHAQQASLPFAVGGEISIPVNSIRQARFSGTMAQQYDFSCGSAAVATLLTHHYGYPVLESTVFVNMFRHGDQEKIRREGFSLLDMKRFLLARGFEADGFEQPLDKLAEARLPAIALINENGYMHFVVIKGLKGDRVLIGDPANGTRAVKRAVFEANWKGGLLFVIHNQMNYARFNVAEDWRSAPQAPLVAGINREGLAGISIPKNGPGDF